MPVVRLGEKLVTTVFDLLMAQYAVGRDGLPGQWPASYGDPQPYTPAWQEAITSVPAAAAARVAREFARNAELSRGRSMIAMGAGTNHWFHSDQIYRTFLTLTMLCGCQGVNGGGWAHYVGQEKVRPLTGFQTLAFALDWQRPTRHMTGTLSATVVHLGTWLSAVWLHRPESYVVVVNDGGQHPGSRLRRRLVGNAASVLSH